MKPYNNRPQLAVVPADSLAIQRFGLVHNLEVLIFCVVAQVTLGLAPWVVKFGWPAIPGDHLFAASLEIGEKGFVQTTVVTAHGALGSLILAFLTFFLCRSVRIALPRPATVSDRSMEVSR